MQFPEQSAIHLTEAIADMRRCMVDLLPAGAELEEARAKLRRIEIAALQNLALQQVAAEESPDGIFMVEPIGTDFRCLFANPAFISFNGFFPGALVGKLLSATEKTAQIHDRCCETLTGGAARSYDDRINRPDCVAELQTQLTPLFDGEENCYAIVGVSRDVTEMRMAERQLRKQNRRMQNILGSISDGFVVVDKEWQITFVNKRAEAILGHTRAELIGAPLSAMFPDLSVEKLREPAEVQYLTPTWKSGLPDSAAHWTLARAFPSQDGTAIYLQDISDRKQSEHALKKGLDQLQACLDGVVNAMAFAVEMRDPYTGGHQRRVSALACAIARALGYSADQVETLRIAGLLHDVGKISIPAEILNRPGMLSEPEYLIVRTHAQIGYEILKEIEFSAPVALIALQHHERLDGSGYPQGLHAGAIIQEARILAIADVVEAMASHRPYRAALGVECALKEVMNHRGLRYDETAVDACLTVFKESGFDFEQMMQTELERRSHDINSRPGR